VEKKKIYEIILFTAVQNFMMFIKLIVSIITHDL